MFQKQTRSFVWLFMSAVAHNGETSRIFDSRDPLCWHTLRRNYVPHRLSFTTILAVAKFQFLWRRLCLVVLSRQRVELIFRAKKASQHPHHQEKDEQRVSFVQQKEKRTENNINNDRRTKDTRMRGFQVGHVSIVPHATRTYNNCIFVVRKQKKDKNQKVTEM